MALTSNTLAAGLTAEETSSQANDLIYSERAGTGHKITRDNFLGVIVAQLAADTTPSQARTTLGVPVLSDDETLADASATQSVSERAVKAYIDGFTSTNQTITSGGLLTLPHGRPARPGSVDCWLQCTTAEAGYSVGDVIQAHLNSSSSGTTQLNTVYADETNVYLRFSSNLSCFSAGNKSTGVYTVLTNANWEIIVEARV